MKAGSGQAEGVEGLGALGRNGRSRKLLAGPWGLSPRELLRGREAVGSREGL